MNQIKLNEKWGKLSLLISAISVIFVIYLSFFKGGNISKIGVVDMDKLVYDFKGMKEATDLYTKKIGSWSQEKDSLENQLRFYVKEIKLDSINGDKNKLNLDKQRFLVLRRSYYELDQNIQQKSQKEDQEMTVGVINQIKAYMKEYAEKNGYELVLTNTQMQSVGYVRSVHEITSSVLTYANERFEGEK